MTEGMSNKEGSASPPPNAVRSLDAVDEKIVRILERDARLPNNAIARAVGIAPSTCLTRMRSLQDRGVLRGYHADLDPSALGRHLQAMIAVRLQPQARRHLRQFGQHVAQLPEVLNVFFLAGADDFLVHIAATSSDEIRNFVVLHLSGNSDVAGTETNLIFEHLRSAVVSPHAALARGGDRVAGPC